MRKLKRLDAFCLLGFEEVISYLRQRGYSIGDEVNVSVNAPVNPPYTTPVALIVNRDSIGSLPYLIYNTPENRKETSKLKRLVAEYREMLNKNPTNSKS